MASRQAHARESAKSPRGIDHPRGLADQEIDSPAPPTGGAHLQCTSIGLALNRRPLLADHQEVER